MEHEPDVAPGLDPSPTRIDSNQCRAHYRIGTAGRFGERKSCPMPAVHTLVGQNFCHHHWLLRMGRFEEAGVKLVPPSDTCCTPSSNYVYVMATPEVLKVGKSRNPLLRSTQVARAGLPGWSLVELDLVATRPECTDPTHVFNESWIHGVLGYKHRVANEWWLNNSEIGDILKGVGLGW